MVYQYLTGPRFRQRVEAIVEAFSSMGEDLDKERKAFMKQWAKREEQIERVMGATVGMYGDLQGIAGKSIQEIEGLEFPAIEFKDVDGHRSGPPGNGPGSVAGRNIGRQCTIDQPGSPYGDASATDSR